MNHVEKLIAKLIDEHKITGEEAIVLIKNCKSSDYSTNLDGLWKDTSIKPYAKQTHPNANVSWDNSNFVRDLGNGISMTQ